MKSKQRCWFIWGAIFLTLSMSGCFTGNLFRNRDPFAGSSNDSSERSFEVPQRHSSTPDKKESSSFKPNDSLKLPIQPEKKKDSSKSNSKNVRENLNGPRIIPQGIEVPASLQLSVEVAAKRQVGSQVTFRLRLRNSGSRDANHVQVESLFDAGFIFPGHPEKKITRTFAKIPAGTSKEFALTLTSDTVGKHCCQFRVSQENREQEWKSVCVEFIPRKLQISLIGPPKRFVGNRVEYTLKISNISNENLSGTEMTLRYSDALIPKEASRGAKQQSDFLKWELGKLKPGEGMQVQAEFECRKPSARSCVSLEATSIDLPQTLADSCLKIVAVKDHAVLHVSDSNDPIKVGDLTSYRVTVENPTGKPMQNLQVTAVVPDRFRILSTMSKKGKKTLDWKAEIQGSHVIFSAIPELKSFEKQHFLVQVKALKTGDATFRAMLSTSQSPTSTTLIEITTVND